MANRAAQRMADEQYKTDQENRSVAMRNTKYRRMYVTKKNTEKVTFISKYADKLPLYLHGFKGTKPLSVQTVCPVKQYRARDCEICETEGTYGPNYPRLVHVFLGYCHTYEGLIRKSKKGKKYKVDATVVIEIPPGGEEQSCWEPLIAADEAGAFNKRVFQLKKLKKGFAVTPLLKEDRLSLRNKGIVPQEAREELEALSVDELWGQILVNYGGVDWAYFDVVEPEPPPRKKDDEDELDDDEDGDSASDDDDDEEQEAKSSNKSRARSAMSKKPSHDEDEDESEDDDDEDDDE